MDVSTNKAPAQMSLFQVFLRLRPPMQQKQNHEPWLLVEPVATTNTAAATKSSEQVEDVDENQLQAYSTHITLQPPNDSRKRAIERFGFTKVFHEHASQLDVFEEIGALANIDSVLRCGRDGLIATLGVTGSGKSHTVLGTKTQRGLTQMSLDVIFHSIGSNIRGQHHPDMPIDNRLISSLQASDASEAQIIPATTFLESMFAAEGDRGRFSRAQTPMAGIGSRAQTPLVVSPTSGQVPGAFPAATDTFNQVRSRTHQVPETPVRSRMPTELRKSTARRDPPSAPGPSVWQRLFLHKKFAKSSIAQEGPSQNSRKPPMPRPSNFAQEPGMSGLFTEVDSSYDYAVVVSMYEVYNDRIFDLLTSTSPSGTSMSSRAGALQKGLMRRPLLFKNTELSPDRKVVAGLKKVVCSSYDEAIMVLEAGLLERRVAGTGSNSASSRSHGFFCIEVKKKVRGNDYASSIMNQWQGAALSIVDLAGSERARNAKTTGSTLAEAGKINESLMYLGQCLQVQSDCQHDGTKPIIPFRQCKLTELLFSNSFPTLSNPTQSRAPQKAVMIVTADAQGDFNATSQILRYSALAREVTVPRIPSVTEAMRALKATGHSSQSTAVDSSYNSISAQEMGQARHEINRLAEECDALVVKLTEEEIRRTEAELRLQAAEERAVAIEQSVREECWQEMETMLEQEKARWRAALNEERFNSQEYMDEKIEIIEKNASFHIHEDQPDAHQRIEGLEHENNVLRAKLAALERDANTRSPTKKKPAIKTPGKKAQHAVFEEVPRIASVQNAFLTSLREIEKETLVLRPAMKEIADGEENHSPCLSDISPRKLSLRNGRTSVMFETPPPQTPATTKKKRILKSKKWEVDDDAF